MKRCAICHRSRRVRSSIYAGEKLGIVHRVCYCRRVGVLKTAPALEQGPAPIPPDVTQ